MSLLLRDRKVDEKSMSSRTTQSRTRITLGINRDSKSLLRDLNQLMVILENTKTQLKFRYRPYFIWFSTSGLMVVIFLLVLIIYSQFSWLTNLLWIPILLLFSLVGSGLAIILVGRVVTYHFDKDYNSLAIKRRGLVNTKVSWHPLADVLDVQLQSTSWQHHDEADYDITLFLKSGESLTLNLGLKSIAQKLETLNLIRKFLGMPPERWR